jgi:hypothetical protein
MTVLTGGQQIAEPESDWLSCELQKLNALLVSNSQSQSFTTTDRQILQLRRDGDNVDCVF